MMMLAKPETTTVMKICVDVSCSSPAAEFLTAASVGLLAGKFDLGGSGFLPGRDPGCDTIGDSDGPGLFPGRDPGCDTIGDSDGDPGVVNPVVYPGDDDSAPGCDSEPVVCTYTMSTGLLNFIDFITWDTVFVLKSNFRMYGFPTSAIYR